MLNNLMDGLAKFSYMLNNLMNYLWFRVQFGKTCTSEFFKDYQNCSSPKDERNLKSLKNSRLYVFPNARETILLLNINIHEKIMHSRV
jgi:hypothetical protein